MTISITEILKKELESEAQTTRKFLERVPEDKYQWRPHEKSMTLHELAGHIAEIPAWADVVINKDELDFAQMNYSPPKYANNKELLDLYEQKLEVARKNLNKANDELLAKPWVMRTGDKIHANATKGAMIRDNHNQVVHHRAQLGVYFRLLGIPVPGSYGPSADEQNF